MGDNLGPLIERERIGALVSNNFPAPSVALLRRIFELTPSEASIARDFARGSSMAEIAALRHSQPCSIKTHLAHIFGKTNTMKQGALVALLCNLAWLEHHANVIHERVLLCEMLDAMRDQASADGRMICAEN
jgi:DNA-binding CsgD family transcriptional regulator